MATVTNSCLYHFKEILEDLEFGGDYEAYNVLVLSVSRYTSDPMCVIQTKTEDSFKSWSDVYDIVLTDHRHKLKCVLSADLNHLVQTRQLCPGSLIKLTECSLLVNEQDVTCGEFIYVNRAEVLDVHHRSRIPDERLLWVDSAGERSKLDIPLVGTRGCYSSVWSDEEMYSEAWKKKLKPKFRRGGCNIHGRIKISKLSDDWQELGHSYPLLCVRVLQKNRPRYYAKVDKCDKWPYQAQLIVADDSGICIATLWNRACTEIYNSIEEGSVLILHNYVVKEVFKPLNPASLSRSNLPLFDIEVNINRHHPAAKLAYVHPRNVEEEWNLPEKNYNFMTRHQLSSLPDKAICDVCGVVVFVSRWERKRKKGAEGLKSGGFWVKRWVKLVDNSSQEPIVVEIYRSGRGDVHDKLSPGHLVVCTNMCLVHSPALLTQGLPTGGLYLTTTTVSQIYTAGDHYGKPYTDDPHYNRVVEWASSDVGRQRYEHQTLGGYFTHPPLPHTLSDYTQMFDEESPLKVTSSDDLREMVRGMLVYESQTVTVQAYLIQVEYVSPTQWQARPPLEGPATTASHVTTRLQSKQQQQSHKSTTKKSKKKQNEKSTRQPVHQATKAVVSEVFTPLMETLPVIGAKQANPLVIPRVYVQGNAAFLQQELALPITTLPLTRIAGNLSGIASPHTHGHFIATFLNLGRSLVIRTLLIVPPAMSGNTSLLDIMSGKIVQTTDTPQPGPSEPKRGRPSKSPRNTSSFTEAHVQGLMESVATVNRKRFVCVLNMYSYGVNKDIEIVLNRGYVA